jgi:glycosyltransferase involved in cell wall biosynthesis
MKVLFDTASPFMLAHGGMQIQILNIKAGLEACGVTVEFVRWWDDKQTGNLIHFFGIPRLDYLKNAQQKAIPLLATHLMSATCNRSNGTLRLQGLVTRGLNAIPGWGLIRNQTTWPTILALQKIIVGLDAEKQALRIVFGLSDEKIVTLPLGLSSGFHHVPPGSRNQPWLITTGTITKVKRSVELAEMAHTTGVPILFVGKPYCIQDQYWQRFASLIDDKLVLYRNHVENEAELIKLYGQARGYVHLSCFENWSLSAHEAAACGLPILVQDQKWSRERFANQAQYWPAKLSTSHGKLLRDFYDRCPSLSPPMIKIHSWQEIGAQLKSI